MGDLVGPVAVDCPLRCDIPEGAVLRELDVTLVPYGEVQVAMVITSENAEMVICPNTDEGCARAFLIVERPES